MLSAERRRALKARAHHLKPVVLIGQHGLTPAVLAEIDIALTAHELIKVRFRATERDERASAIAQAVAELQAEFVASIGGTAIVYRQRPQQPRRRARPRKSPA